MVDEKKYVDVNVFVYWLGAHPTLGGKAKNWVREIEKASRGSYVTSSLTVYEVLVILAGLTEHSLRDEEFVGKVLKAILSLHGLEVVPVLHEDYSRAFELMREYGLDFEDSIHLAVALREKAVKIVSNDMDFDKTPLTRVF